jgi:CheY-like chemotaxis protein
MMLPSAAQFLAIAIHELTTNAAKYGALSCAEGRVAVTWHLTREGLHLSWDESRGPPISGPPQRQGFGTRVIATGVERQLRGHVTFDWRPQGLLVRILVPSEHLVLEGEDHRRGEELARTSPRPPYEPRARLAHRRILVVEDEALIAVQIEDLLAGQGCAVVGPATGLDSAVALASSERLDAAILDVNLSGATTEPVAARLRQRCVPFIVLTGYATEAVTAAYDGAPVVAKPFEEERLLDILAHEISERTTGQTDATMP